VREFIAARFSAPFLRMNARDYRKFLFDLPKHDIAGGAAYDALVAVTAATHSAELITCDRRAAPLYERYGVRWRIL
jgi:hypothetical protein